MENKLIYLANKLREIEDFCEDHSEDRYDDVLWEVEQMIKELKKYADENGVPFRADAEEIVNRCWDGDLDYEEESSSYYEDDSYYDDEEDEDSNEDEDNY